MIIHCPKCTNIVAKGFEELKGVNISFSFVVRCAHCKHDIQVQLGTAVIYEEKLVIDGRAVQDNRSKDPPRIRTLG